jgi:hypothetical protein
MILHPPYGPVFLMPGQAIRLPEAGALELRVRDGSVWLTEAGNPDDHLLAANERHCIGRGADVVISAFAPSRLELVDAGEGCRERPGALRAAEPVPA